MRYKKKPVIIDALQWTENTTLGEMIKFTNQLVRLDDVSEEFHLYDKLNDRWLSFEWNDWVIKGVQGELYPCKPDIFEATYEEVTYPIHISGPDDLGALA